ncbi:MAG TPA: three-Cys-motif partner protein TcmP [Xanthobacteraceae bacterium]|jgi:three-Cys-motif partner protein
MVTIEDYKDREQSYVKHVFLESYLERLAHKTASQYPHVVYIDGFAGPWQSAHEDFQDTSFGVALNALSRAKNSWKASGRDVHMSAHLVERDPDAYNKLASIPSRYPDITVRTYEGDFLTVLPNILSEIPTDAFAFFLIDPKGWRLPLTALAPLLRRANSEVIFNFMFDFINRAASIRDPAVVAGLNELIPFGDWRQRLQAAERDGASPDVRKAILVEAFSECLVRLGQYRYVAETTVLRPVKDRPLYCLFYATRHPIGIEVFRDSQIKALEEQSKARATGKVRHAEATTGQREIFESLHDMAPNELAAFLEGQRQHATALLLRLTPDAPSTIRYHDLWPQILARLVVRHSDVNRITAQLRRHGLLVIPDWERSKRVPQPEYRVQKAR